MSGYQLAHRRFLSYIDKSREYYRARGFEEPYRWATHEDAPFHSLPKPLSDSRLALVTTTTLSSAESKIKEVYAAPTNPPPESLYTDHLFWHKKATHTKDVESFLPIRRLEYFASVGRIGSASPRFYGAPMVYSQRKSSQEDAPAILDLCRSDGVDAVIVVAL